MINKKIFDEFEITPFDILFNDLFDINSMFLPVLESKIKYPIDIYEIEDKGLYIDLSIAGLDKDAIYLGVKDSDILELKYIKDHTENKNNESKKWIVRNISKKSFNFKLKISSKFNIDKLKAEFDNGELNIFIPLTKSKASKRIDIKNKK